MHLSLPSQPFSVQNLNTKNHIKGVLSKQFYLPSHHVKFKTLQLSMHGRFLLHHRPQRHSMTDSQRQKTYHRTCALSEDSDQTAHSRSLIWIFTGRMLDWQECSFAVWSESSLGACWIGKNAVSSFGERRLIRVRGCAGYWSDCADLQADMS